MHQHDTPLRARLTVESTEADASLWGSVGSHTTFSTDFVWPFRTAPLPESARMLEPSTFHSITVQSAEPDANLVPVQFHPRQWT